MAYNHLELMTYSWQKTLNYDKTNQLLSGAMGEKRKVKEQNKITIFQG